ncbi:MAG: hypothetical protein LC803_09595 [Acidobacteria bacterium]|nr:hypothetical protein [Acidobacteriota bacterium]
MEDEIRPGGLSTKTSPESPTGRKLIPMQIGNAVVYVEHFGEAAPMEVGDDIYPVAPNPKQVFETAVEVLKECVRVVGERVEQLAGKAMPKEVEVEFSLTFDAKAKGALIPIFVTAEHGLQTGLKVKAVWKQLAATDPVQSANK